MSLHDQPSFSERDPYSCALTTVTAAQIFQRLRLRFYFLEFYRPFREDHNSIQLKMVASVSDALQGTIFERERAFIELPANVQEEAKSLFAYFISSEGKTELTKHCGSKKCKTGSFQTIKGSAFLSLVEASLKRGDDTEPKSETSAALSPTPEEIKQLAYALVFCGLLTPYKENESPIGPFSFDTELYVVVISLSAENEEGMSVWRVKEGAIQAGFLKRKGSGIFSNLRGSKKAYVIVNETQKLLGIFESDHALKTQSVIQFTAESWVEFDSNIANAIKVHNKDDSEVLIASSKEKAEEWLNACINAGAQYREAFTKNIDEVTSFYELSDFDMEHKEISMSNYKGKVLLIVNVSSMCGLTPANYTDLVALDEKYRDQGLQVLAFPCNQFANQEPGTHEEIMEFVKQYKCTFPFFEKADVNGAKARPVFMYLKAKLPGSFGNFVKWNFTKFLVDRDGKPHKRYAPKDPPLSFEDEIKTLLAAETEKVEKASTTADETVVDSNKEAKTAEKPDTTEDTQVNTAGDEAKQEESTDEEGGG
uniref:Glutathione peroxidase n=1 Tax=Albugo laibachii Nc14 TaxID=890382 RepID=F0WDZ2_9STRA|nr:phospholipid hydroperoxide glutathione peroxidase pu [Albugo laibachii Nc14]|eukprot:CCA19420.1 phospholipid hydroperoxide glutathione peroxidase pu [Albugo laibachii Nc14]